MALNPNTIKALFGKLAPLADDAAGAVAKYGDDALAMAGKVDDFLPPASVADTSAQQALKERLLYKRSPAAFEAVPFPAPWPHIVPDYNADKVADQLRHYDFPSIWGGFPETTRYLGDVKGQLSIEDELLPWKNKLAVQVPELPTSQLVAQEPMFGTSNSSTLQEL